MAAKKSPPPGSTPARSAPAPIASLQEAMARLEQLYKTLEYDQVIPAADQLLARDDLSLAQRLEVYRLQGSARAIVEDPVDAERPFRLLLRAQPDYDLPADTPPKILAVFRKVQSEEKALAAQLRDVERARLIGNLKLTGEPTPEPVGGRPIRFVYRLRDTAGVVTSVRVEYRRGGRAAFSSLALERTEEGDWRGVVPGELTASEAPYTLEYLVTTADSEGPLLALGTTAAPLTLSVKAGQVPTTAFKPVSKGAFWSVFGLTAALGVATGVTGLLFNQEQAAYREASRQPSAVGSVLSQQAERGQAFAEVTNVLLIVTAVSLVAMLVLLPLTRFVDE
ncbi:MAG: hypothetical protein SFW67_27845 [Myxococcaceae bacterium]|nr:hypothetical protein [Myxococcaceae bacterium]